MTITSTIKAIFLASALLFAAEPALAAQLPPQHSRTRPSKAKKQTKDERKASETTNKKDNKKPGTKSKKNAKAESISGNYRALKVNIPYAAAVIQNLAFEWQTGPKMTVDIPLMWSFSDLTWRHGLRTVAIQPEARWWPGANPGSGHFLGAHASVAWFNLKWNDSRYQADSLPLLGAGISYGYRLPFTAHWGAEFNIGAGYAYMEYDTFYNIDNGAKINRRSRHYFGITRIGLSLVYRF